MTDPASDPYNLHRFLDAQAPAFDQVLAELRGGRKRSHWMWFIFPQIAGLGSSEMARLFAISGRAEAEAYLATPPSARACANAPASSTKSPTAPSPRSSATRTTSSSARR